MGGIFLSIISGLGFGLFQAINRRAAHGVDPFQATFVLLFVSSCVLIAISALTVASVEVDIIKKSEAANRAGSILKHMEVRTLISIQSLIVISQGTSNQKSINYSLMQQLKKNHENDFSLILKDLKVNMIMTLLSEEPKQPQRTPLHYSQCLIQLLRQRC